MKILVRIIDYLNQKVEDLSISRWHIFTIFFVLGGYLVVLPLLKIIHVSIELEATIGNYTNIISAGVSLLTLAEARRIRNDAHQNHEKLKEHLDKPSLSITERHTTVSITKDTVESSDLHQNLQEPEF